MSIRYLPVASFVSFALLTGCGGPADDTSSTSLTEWLGESPHFAVSGSFNGQPIDIRLEKDAATAAGVYCQRNYAPLPGNVPDANGKYDMTKLYFAMKEVGAIVDLDGQKRELTFGYWRHEPAAGTTVEVVPRTFGTTVAAGKTWMDIGIVEPGMPATTGVESAAESGTLAMKVNTSVADAEDMFVAGGGKTGEFVSLSWGPHDKLTISVTAECRETAMAPWAVNLIKP